MESWKKVNLSVPSAEETDLAHREEAKVPLGEQERVQTLKLYEAFKEKAQWGEFYRLAGICLCFLGGYFLTVPFYNVVCQTFGFSMSLHAKDYHFRDDESKCTA